MEPSVAFEFGEGAVAGPPRRACGAGWCEVVGEGVDAGECFADVERGRAVADAASISVFRGCVSPVVNILIAPELSTADALAVLGPALETAENAGRDMMAVIGADAATPAASEPPPPP